MRESLNKMEVEDTNSKSLTAREYLIAEKVKTMIKDEWYADIGRTVVHRIFVLVGIAAVFFVLGKGWVDFSVLFSKNH
jgi:hypothetical protein